MLNSTKKLMRFMDSKFKLCTARLTLKIFSSLIALMSGLKHLIQKCHL